jgi:hypothetical protein
VYLVRVSLSHSIQCQAHLEAAAIGEGSVAFVVIVEAASEAEADGLSTEVVLAGHSSILVRLRNVAPLRIFL